MINVNKFEGAIRAAGFTQRTLAKAMGISENTFGTKKKKGTFTLAQVQQICDLCKISSADDKCDIFLPIKFQ